MVECDGKYLPTRRACILASGSLIGLSGCSSPFTSSSDVPGIQAVILTNETATAQSVTFRIERDGEVVYDEKHTIDSEDEIVITEDWMTDAGTYVFTVVTGNADRQEESGRPIPFDGEQGACIKVEIEQDDVSILQRLADGPCP